MTRLPRWIPVALLAPALVGAALPARAETGYDAWLRYEPIQDAALKRSYEATLPDTLVVLGDSPILKSAQAERTDISCTLREIMGSAIRRTRGSRMCARSLVMIAIEWCGIIAFI